MIDTAQRHASTQPPKVERGMLYLVVFLFFAWGFSTVLNDSLLPKLKGLFVLSHAEGNLTNFAFFLSYLIFSIPAGLILARVGYLRGAALGLVITAAGCLLFTPAVYLNAYPPFLLALFVMAAGITMLQVAANPFIELLGSEETSHSRLTLAQAFNSLATMIGPWIGAVTILRGGVSIDASGLSAAALEAARKAELAPIQRLFLVMGVIFIGLAAVFWARRGNPAPPVPGQASLRAIPALFNRPRLMVGTLAIFVYVGAEVFIGSNMANYFMEAGILGATAEHAGKLVSFYWGGAMVGRFIGAYVLRRIAPGSVLAAFAIGAGGLTLLSSFTHGDVAAYALIAVGLCNSIMFPTIFSLATEGLGAETPHGSALLCMAIVGGAIIPEIAGLTADAVGLSLALLIPAACYLIITIYGLLTWRGLSSVSSPAGLRES